MARETITSPSFQCQGRQGCAYRKLNGWIEDQQRTGNMTGFEADQMPRNCMFAPEGGKPEHCEARTTPLTATVWMEE